MARIRLSPAAPNNQSEQSRIQIWRANMAGGPVGGEVEGLTSCRSGSAHNCAALIMVLVSGVHQETGLPHFASHGKQRSPCLMSDKRGPQAQPIEYHAQSRA